MYTVTVGADPCVRPVYIQMCKHVAVSEHALAPLQFASIDVLAFALRLLAEMQSMHRAMMIARQAHSALAVPTRTAILHGNIVHGTNPLTGTTTGACLSGVKLLVPHQEAAEQRA